MANLPSRDAVRLMLLAEKEMFGKLVQTVEAVRDSGDWRNQGGQAEEIGAVKKWLDENWRAGFIDDGDLVAAWLGELPPSAGGGSSALREAVETEQSVAIQLSKIVTD